MKRRSPKSLQGGLWRARARNLRVVQPKPNEVQIDLDGTRALHTFSRQWRMLKDKGLANGWRAKFSRSFSANHAHITVVLPCTMSLKTRVFLAALLGSDLKREMFNYIRVSTRRRIPVAFFEARRRA